jgi:hypothetical protein
VVWLQGGAQPLRRDLPAHRLGRIIVDQVLGPEPESMASAVVSETTSNEMKRALATPS